MMETEQKINVQFGIPIDNLRHSGHEILTKAVISLKISSIGDYCI